MDLGDAKMWSTRTWQRTESDIGDDVDDDGIDGKGIQKLGKSERIGRKVKKMEK